MKEVLIALKDKLIAMIKRKKRKDTNQKPLVNVSNSREVIITVIIHRSEEE